MIPDNESYRTFYARLTIEAIVTLSRTYDFQLLIGVNFYGHDEEGWH